MDILFIINQDIYGHIQVSQYDWGFISGIYTDLETAKSALKNIYNKKPDYNFYGYKITVYKLEGTEYKMTNKIYTYTFDKFSEFN